MLNKVRCFKIELKFKHYGAKTVKAMLCSEVVSRELIIPIGLVVSGFHREFRMVYTSLVPLSELVENEHLLGDVISVDHIEVDAVVLLEETSPLCGPIVI